MLASSANAAPGAVQTYPLVSAYHFTGTPFAVAFFDGGTAGRIAVMYEFNLKGIVPNSYGAVITSLYDIEVRADKKRHLSVVSTFPRPDALARPAGLARPELASPQPDLAQLPKLPIKNFTGEERKTFLRDDPTETSFIFFVNDTTGEEILASNPQKSAVSTLIPGATALQVTIDVFQIFPVGPDGHTSVATGQDVPQPPLTSNLDEALAALKQAIAHEKITGLDLSKKAVNTDLHLGIKQLDKASKALQRATAAGEIVKGTTLGQTHIADLIEDAVDLDQRAIAATTGYQILIRQAVTWKMKASSLILKAVGRAEDPLA